MVVLIGIVALVVWLSRSNERGAVDKQSLSYRQGYWDGVRAAQSGEVAQLAGEAAVTEASLKEQTDLGQNQEGITQVQSVVSNKESPGMTIIGNVDENVSYQTVSAVTPTQHRENNRKATINIALYAASLLLVGGILLLSQAMELTSEIRFSLIWLMIVVYYTAGFVLYGRVPIVKPAATAFVGTALASLPFGGASLSIFLGVSPALCWAITSLLGAGLFVAATLRLNSQLLAYISLVSLLIFSASMPAVMDAQLIWYYVVLMVFGVILTTLSYLSPKMPRQFIAPISQGGIVVVPGVVVMATMTYGLISELEYSMMLLAGTAYYMITGIVEQKSSRRTYELVAARVLAIATLASFASYISGGDRLIVSVVISLAALMSVAISLYRLPPYQKPTPTHHEISLWIGLGLALMAPIWICGDGLSSLSTTALQSFYAAVSAEYILLLGVSAWALLRLRRLECGYIATVVLAVLPYTIAALLSNDIVQRASWAFVGYLITASIVMLLRFAVLKRRTLNERQAALIYGSVGAWLCLAALQIGALPQHGLLYGAALAGYMSVLSGVIVWRERQSVFILAVQALLLATIALICTDLRVAHETMLILLAWINVVGAIAYAEYRCVRRGRGNDPIRSLLTRSTWIFGVLIALSTVHPAVWLPVVGALYYMTYREHSMEYLGIANGASVGFLLLLGSWLHVSWNENLTIASWAALVGFGGMYWMFARRNARAATVALGSATLPAILFGLIVWGNDAQPWLTVVSWLALVIALHIFVYAQRSSRPLLLLAVANASIVALGLLTARWAGLNFFTMAPVVALLSLLAFYYAALVIRRIEVYKDWSSVYFWSAIGWSVTLSLAALVDTTLLAETLVAGVTLILASGVLFYEGSRRKPTRLWYFDAAALIALQGVTAIIVRLVPDVHSLVISHLWALAAMGVAALYWKYRTSTASETTAHIVVALLILSLPTFSTALFGDIRGPGPQVLAQILFLAEHAGLVIVGMILGKRLIALWGAAGVTAAIIFLLSGYTYLLSITIGLLIIGAVVYAIVRDNKKRKG